MFLLVFSLDVQTFEIKAGANILPTCCTIEIFVPANFFFDCFIFFLCFLWWSAVLPVSILVLVMLFCYVSNLKQRLSRHCLLSPYMVEYLGENCTNTSSGLDQLHW